MQHADTKYAEGLKRGMSFAEGNYRQQRQDRAHRRLLSAVRTLATVRKLGPSVLQVNIGDKQVNVAQVGAGPVPNSAEGKDGRRADEAEARTNEPVTNAEEREGRPALPDESA